MGTAINSLKGLGNYLVDLGGSVIKLGVDLVTNNSSVAGDFIRSVINGGGLQ